MTVSLSPALHKTAACFRAGGLDIDRFNRLPAGKGCLPQRLYHAQGTFTLPFARPVQARIDSPSPFARLLAAAFIPRAQDILPCSLHAAFCAVPTRLPGHALLPVTPFACLKSVTLRRFPRAQPRLRRAATRRATLISSLAGTTHASAGEPSREILRSCAPSFLASSSSMPRWASAWQTRARTMAEFSPMPPVNTRASNPPSTA